MRSSLSRDWLSIMPTLLELAEIRRVAVVGGTRQSNQKFQRLFNGSPVEVRLVSGVRRRGAAHAEAVVRWADLVVIRGGTPLMHTVSGVYIGAARPAGKLVVTHRAGFLASCIEVADWLRKHRDVPYPGRIDEVQPARAAGEGISDVQGHMRATPDRSSDLHRG